MKYLSFRDLVWFTVLVGLLWMNSAIHYHEILNLRSKVKTLESYSVDPPLTYLATHEY